VALTGSQIATRSRIQLEKTPIRPTKTLEDSHPALICIEDEEPPLSCVSTAEDPRSKKILRGEPTEIGASWVATDATEEKTAFCCRACGAFGFMRRFDETGPHLEIVGLVVYTQFCGDAWFARRESADRWRRGAAAPQGLSEIR